MDSLPKISQIDISTINRNASNQMREVMRDDVVIEYAEAMAAGAVFPPVKVYRDDDGKFHLSDGFHRAAAAESIGATTISATVEHGSERTAWMNSLGVNDTHGLRRTQADKRNAVAQALSDEELRGWSNNQVAKVCNVSAHTVKAVRDSMNLHSDNHVTYKDRWGNTTTMDTAGIGRKAEPVDETPVDGSIAVVIKRLVVKHGAASVRRAADAVLEEMAEWE